jgi:hypothetical protein
MYKNRADYERAVTYGNYDLPMTFPDDSPYRKYQGTALGSRLRGVPEEKWWRHLPVLPDKVPGCDEANRRLMYLPLFTSEVPELVEQYVEAFEKVWAHRKELG